MALLSCNPFFQKLRISNQIRMPSLHQVQDIVAQFIVQQVQRSLEITGKKRVLQVHDF